MGQLQITLLLLIVCTCSISISIGFGFTCNEAERKALLKFKHSFTDPCNNGLSSWVGQDCCSWKGVGCDNVTGNVIKLDLSPESLSYLSCLNAGEVNPALLELKYLTYLDLSHVYFNRSRFPDFFGSMRQLQHLDLSYAFSFTGKVPNVLGNLTQLVFLDLSFACFHCEMETNSLEWAFNLKKLKYLGLDGIDLSQALDGLNILHKLPYLLCLTLHDCQMENSHLFIRNSTVYSKSPIQHLYLGRNNFDGPIPHFIHNMSAIRSLDLSSNHFISPIPSWLEDKVDLEYLNLANNDFNGSFPHFNDLGRLSSLSHLRLSHNHFRAVSTLSKNLSSLQIIDISNNKLEALPPFFGGLSPLLYLDLSHNNLSVLSSIIGNLSSLQTLDLSNNNLETLPSSLWKLSSLSDLDLSYNNVRVVSPAIGNFSSLERLDLSNNSLETLHPSSKELASLSDLDLSYNHFSVMPPFIGSLSSLQYLNLSHNNLLALPPSLGRLSSLSSLDLSHNNLSVVHQVSLANLSSLRRLDISSNSATLDISPDWMPPFHLRHMSVLPCKLNSLFPKWILSQENLKELDLSNSGLFGSLPKNIGDAMPSLQSLRLANNHINGSIPRSLCGIAGLGLLDLQKNRLSGKIPDCWANSQILGVELSSNRLSGHIPNSLTKIAMLQLLRLSNNSLKGELPFALINSTELTILDVGRNKLHGEIPIWNGANLPFLQILIVRENRFSGSIPLQLCSFHTLHLIDLASNNLTGTIPRCFGYFQGMGSIQHSSAVIASPPSPTTSHISPAIASGPAVSPDEWSAVEVIKGEEREYTTNLHLLVNMDLSSNQLVGVIPAEITSLSSLLGLNLSHNHLKGTIPTEIGKMASLESLDLSSNNLSGSIPESISSLDYLSDLNLSFNNLQGRIPTGRHLQTLEDPSIYMGNPSLCGDPLPKKCSGDDNAHPPASTILEDEGDNKKEKMWFYIVIMLGFATGFWGVIGILVAHKKWRHAYFQLAEDLADWIYVIFTVSIARANGGR